MDGSWCNAYNVVVSRGILELQCYIWKLLVLHWEFARDLHCVRVCTDFVPLVGVVKLSGYLTSVDYTTDQRNSSDLILRFIIKG